jgi:hypothetical protein
MVCLPASDKGEESMLRTMMKILLFPVTGLLCLVECVCSAAVGLSGIIFRLVGGVFILFAVLSFGFGLEPWAVALRMILGGIVFLAIPIAGTFLTAGIALIRTYIRTI